MFLIAKGYFKKGVGTITIIEFIVISQILIGQQKNY